MNRLALIEALKRYDAALRANGATGLDVFGLRLLASLIGLWPTHALAEVMDKEPSLYTLWTWTAAFIALAALVARWKALLALVVWPISTLFGISLFLELTDPHVGPAILQEAGWSYVAQAYLSAALCTVGPAIAFAWGLRRRHTGGTAVAPPA